MFHKFVVGEKFPLKGAILDREGTSLNYADEGSLFMLIKWKNICAKEKRELKNGIVQFRYIEEGDYIILLMKLGMLPPMEFPFSPTIYTKNGREFKVRSNILSIYAIEHTNKTLVAMRAIGLNANFLSFLTEKWERNIKDENFAIGYKNWIDKLFSTFTTNELWMRGTPLDWK